MRFSSRSIQNLIHLVGSINSLLLFLSGYFVGKNDLTKFIIFVISYLVLARINSELMYLRQKLVVREELEKSKRN